MAKYTLEQLKAIAYDTLSNIEKLQAQLREINNAIANYKEETEASRDKDGIPTKENPKKK